MLKDLTQGDFEFLKKKATAMKSCHEKEFMKVADPKLMSAFYRGRNKKMDFEDTDERGFVGNAREHFLTLSKIFTATNTLGPQLYYRNPQPQVMAARGGTKEGAALLSAALRDNMRKNDAERQNPEACLSAWFFGIGYKKLGMRNTFLKRVDEPESANLVASAGAQGGNPDALEGIRSDYVLDTQSVFNDVESPENVMLDDDASLWNGRFRLHYFRRSLHDLMNSSAYDEAMLKELWDKLKYDRGSRLDPREIKVNVNELECKQPNGLWVASWVDEFPKALRYDQTGYTGKDFQLLPLVFTNEPFVRYPIAHMKVASQVQEHLDYMATLFIRIIDRVRNQIVVDKTKLAPGMEKALLANKHGGIIFTNGPISSQTYAQLTSAAVSNDIPALMNVVSQNLGEILGADQQLLGGKSSNDTLGQDELARIGTKVRETGMQDKVRKWVIKQFEEEARLMQKYHIGEMNLTVKPQDIQGARVARDAGNQYVSFGTQENPQPFKDAVPGEYDYDFNIYESVKLDKKEQQTEYMEAMKVFADPVVRDAMLEHGTVARIDKLAEGIADNFELIKSADFVEQLDERQTAALQVKKMMMSGGMPKPQVQSETKTSQKPPSKADEVTQQSSVAAQL